MLLLQLRYTSMTAARPPGKSHREGRGSAAAGLSGLLEQIRVGWNRRRRSTDPVNLLYPHGVDRINVARWKIGRASCRGRGCQYGLISVVAVTVKKKDNKR